MISGITSRIILSLLSLAVGIIACVVPTLAWLRPSPLVEAAFERQIDFVSYALSSQATDESFQKSCMLLSAFIGAYAMIRGVQLFKQVQYLYQEQEAENRKSVEDRLDELERLKRRDMVTPEEYDAKRRDILKDL